MSEEKQPVDVYEYLIPSAMFVLIALICFSIDLFVFGFFFECLAILEMLLCARRALE